MFVNSNAVYQCSDHFILTPLVKEHSFTIVWDAWTHDTWHLTDEIDSSLLVTLQPGAGGRRTPHTRYSHTRKSQRVVGGRPCSGRRVGWPLSPTGGWDWVVWVILSTDREMQLLRLTTQCNEACLADRLTSQVGSFFYCLRYGSISDESRGTHS